MWQCFSRLLMWQRFSRLLMWQALFIYLCGSTFHVYLCGKHFSFIYTCGSAFHVFTYAARAFHIYLRGKSVSCLPIWQSFHFYLHDVVRQPAQVPPFCSSPCGTLNVSGLFETLFETLLGRTRAGSNKSPAGKELTVSV